MKRGRYRPRHPRSGNLGSDFNRSLGTHALALPLAGVRIFDGHGVTYVPEEWAPAKWRASVPVVPTGRELNSPVAVSTVQLPVR
jgi:hypothetical protein